MNSISSFCSSLALRIQRWPYSCAFFSFGVAHSVSKCIAVPCSSWLSVFPWWICILLFFGVEGFVLNFTTLHFSSLALKIQCQKSPPLPALLWCSQSSEISNIAPCTSWVSVFPWWICVPLFFGVESFVLNFTAVHFSSFALKIQCQKSPLLLALRWC